MLDLKKATYGELVDLLNAQTAAYIDMLRTRVPEDQFIRCKLLLRKIQTEIESRNEADASSTNGTNTSSILPLSDSSPPQSEQDPQPPLISE